MLVRALVQKSFLAIVERSKATMPFTYNGIGTKYYGRRNPKEDGSFVTTEWIVFAYIPLVPIGSFRIAQTGNSSNWVIYSSTEYLVTRVPLCWQQVRNVYITEIAILGILFGGITLLSRESSNSPPPASPQSQTFPSSK